MSFRDAVQAADHDRIVAAFAPTATLRSPANHDLLSDGRIVAEILCAARSVFADFVYTDELVCGAVHALVFRATVGGQEVEGLDLLRLDDSGLIVELTVMLRPWTIAEAFSAAMTPHFQRLLAGTR
jgi:hypothetical protein